MPDNPWIETLTNANATSEVRKLVFEEMRTALNSGDERACSRALNTVSHVGLAAAELRDDVLAVWNSPRRTCVMRPIVSALARIREVAPLIDAMMSGDLIQSMRRHVPGALRGLGPAAVEAAPALVETLRDDDKRHEAISALSAIGPGAVPALVAGLSDSSVLLRSRSLRVLGFIAKGTKAAVPAVLNALDDPEPKVRAQAAFALGRFDPISEKAYAGLIRSLSDKNSSVRREALAALRDLGTDADDATPHLIALLEKVNGHDNRECIDIVQSLSAIGPAANDAAPLLQRLLANDEGELRMVAALAYYRVAPENEASKNEAAAVLISGTRDDEVEVRIAAIEALGEMGDAAPEGAEAMKSALRSTAEVRAAAAKAASRFPASADRLIPALMNLIYDRDGDTRWYAIQALLSLKATDPAIGEAIKKTLETGAWADGRTSWDDGRCQEAVQLIHAIGPAALPLAPLLEHLREHESSVRPYAVLALANLHGNECAAVPELIAILDDSDPPCPCQAAADCLAAIGPAARDAIPALSRMALFGTNYYDRMVALRALTRIDPQVAAELKQRFS